jgi:hypothetical protein
MRTITATFDTNSKNEYGKDDSITEAAPAEEEDDDDDADEINSVEGEAT